MRSDSTKCSRCDREPVPGQRYCQPCKNAYMREWRREKQVYADLSDDEKLRSNTRAYTNVLIRRGKLIPKPCEECETTEHVEAHHPDYSDPRTVIWLCRKHHRALHKHMRNQTKELETGVVGKT